jgi:Transposase DDE domain
MNEAHQIYDDLLEALEPILPRTVYQDVRRVRMLAWAITGLCLTHTVQLGAWAQVLEGRAQYAASRVRRFSRWLHHPAISPPQWCKPVLQATLVDWPLDHRLYVALDTTALSPFVLIRASLVYRGRAIPLAWRALRHRSTQVSFEAYQPVLDQVHAIVPPGLVITLLADRGFVHEQLLHYLHKQQWHFRLRLPGDTLVHLKAQPVTTIRDLCPPAGESRFFQEVSILGTAVGPLSLALACLFDQPDDPWFVVSDEQTSAQTLGEYGLRFDIEESFLDEKSGGYQIHTSELATPEALERLILILAIATLHLTSIGVGVVQAGKHRWVDTHWDRGLSYLKLGWRWRRQQDQRGWQAFAPFWLDPAPDPLPVLASRRTIVGETNTIDLPNAA